GAFVLAKGLHGAVDFRQEVIQLGGGPGDAFERVGLEIRLQKALILDELRLGGAGKDAHDLAGKKILAGDLDLGIFANEVAVLAGDAELKLDGFAGVRGGNDGFNFASVHALDAYTCADLDAVDVGKADEDVDAAAAPPGALVEDQEGRSAERESDDDEQSEQRSLRAGQISGHKKPPPIRRPRANS